MKRFLVSEKVVKEVVEMLVAYRDEKDAPCARSGCMCDLRGGVCSQPISKVLHDFESDMCLEKK